MAVPHPRGDNDLVFLAERRQPAPHSRLGKVADLRFQEFRQAFAFDYRPRGKPGKDPRRQHIQPYQGVVERHSYRDQENDVRYRNPSKYGYPVDRQRRGQPKVIKLVEPLFYPPDVRIRGQVHWTVLLSEN
jgi:hypothetical protein